MVDARITTDYPLKRKRTIICDENLNMFGNVNYQVINLRVIKIGVEGFEFNISFGH